MGSEAGLWKTFKKNMRCYGEFDRHEDKLNLGVPDVSFVLSGNARTGWIELKHCHAGPKRVTTIFKIKHFTREQKAWLKRRGSCGDCCWVLLQVDREYFLFNWKNAQHINFLTWENTKMMAVARWENTINWAELHLILKKRQIIF